MQVWFLAAALVMLLPLQWRRTRWSSRKDLARGEATQAAILTKPMQFQRRLQAREIGLDLMWVWFLTAASMMSLSLQWRRKTHWSSREGLARGEDSILSCICFGFCIWFCSWVFGTWKWRVRRQELRSGEDLIRKNKKVRFRSVLEAKRSKTKSSPRT